MASIRGVSCRPLVVASALLVALGVAACDRGAATADCPGQFDPGLMTSSELEHHGVGDIPEGSATTLESVQWAVEHRRGWIARNYPKVSSVDVGPGWGVTYTHDQYGNTTYHHTKDYMVVTVVADKSACPDPDRGQLMVIARNYRRVPVRFEYRLKS